MLFVGTNIVMYTKTIKKIDLAAEFEKKIKKLKKLKLRKEDFCHISKNGHFYKNRCKILSFENFFPNFF